MKTDCLICLERPEDYREVETLIRESFWNVYRPGCLEHYVIHVLRDDPAFVPELDFVMEKDGAIIGQKNTPPAIATLLMSLESVFAVVGGAMLLGESLTPREFLGCMLIFFGVLVAQFPLQILFRRVIMKRQ